jgi:mRNA interferase MazF
MIDSYRKVSRGQVWFLVDNDVPTVHTQGSIQGKNRPWLVVSNNKCNQSSPIYTVVPLTTAAKSEMPTHVTFMTGDKQQTILCEQIRSVSQQAFFNAGSHYQFTMSEKYMGLVDEALAVQLGLSLCFPNSDRFWESLERLIRVRVKQAVMDSRVEAVDISKISSLIDAKVESIVNNEVDPEEEKVEEPVEEPVEEVVEEVAEEPKKDWVPVSKPTRTRRTWDENSKKEFLAYIEEHGMKETAEHYNMQIGSVYATKFKFFKEMSETKK